MYPLAFLAPCLFIRFKLISHYLGYKCSDWECIDSENCLLTISVARSAKRQANSVYDLSERPLVETPKKLFIKIVVKITWPATMSSTQT